MYLCVNGIDFASFYDFGIGFWNCSDSVLCFVFHFIANNLNVIYIIFWLNSQIKKNTITKTDTCGVQLNYVKI